MPSDEEIFPAVNVQQIEPAREQGVSPSIKIDRNTILGRGLHGIVFEGTWGNKKVAVKRIQLVNIDNGNKEEKALLKLDHPNIIKLYHIESDEDFKYFALEYCQASLDQLFFGNDIQKKYREKMPSEKEVFLQLAKGLEHIHQMVFFHRDLKPQNVLIHVDYSTGEKFTIKWADFGFSKPVNESGSCSMSGPDRGTNNWYAPEILKMKENEGGSTATSIRHRGTVKSDVFTEGLIFGYYLLNGCHPFGSNFHTLPSNILKNDAVNLKKIILQPPQPIHDVIMEMLKSDPVERISSSDVVSRLTNIK